MPHPLKNKCRAAVCLLYPVFLLLSANLHAQVKWDGEAGDGQWTSAANWTGNTVPANTDDVVLDNSFVTGNYTVLLPGAAATVVIKTITISPAAGNSIQLTLPASSAATPAFSVTGPGYGITIDNGAVFLNASGATSAAAIAVTDSLRVNNGGSYIHNTRSAHAAIVSSLSRLPGTEKGVFTFDVPGGSYTIASTNRVYGTLQLSASASGGSQVYTTSAANPFTINGDLVIKNGVVFNLDITAATLIKGNYVQEGGVFNLASQPNNNTIFIKGDFLQTAGNLTETAAGLPVVELNGGGPQHIRMAGTISNSVGLRINNSTDVGLLSDCVLPYSLALINGILNTQSFLITLLTGCTIHADSAASNSFINGALRKEGLAGDAHFLFPVGKDISQRWLALKNATGNYTVQFFKANPNTLTGSAGAGIHHISSIEYWSVQADAAPAPSANIELSFDNVNSGGVTNMATLRAVQFVAGVWTDRGNASTTGTAGSAGSVISNPVNLFGTFAQYFTLASSDAFQNPLPLKLLSFAGYAAADAVTLKWTIANQGMPAFFELQSAADGSHFIPVALIYAEINSFDYQYTDKRKFSGKQYYRLKCVEADGSFFYTGNLQVLPLVRAVDSLQLWPTVVDYSAVLQVHGYAAGNAVIIITAPGGGLVHTKGIYLQKGINRIPLQLQWLPGGIYWLTVYRSDGSLLSTRFIRTHK